MRHSVARLGLLGTEGRQSWRIAMLKRILYCALQGIRKPRAVRLRSQILQTWKAWGRERGGGGGRKGYIFSNSLGSHPTSRNQYANFSKGWLHLPSSPHPPSKKKFQKTDLSALYPSNHTDFRRPGQFKVWQGRRVWVRKPTQPFQGSQREQWVAGPGKRNEFPGPGSPSGLRQAGAAEHKALLPIPESYKPS